ncbi:cation:proton antiporter [Carboxylicivirga sp. M1479]|uniref:cation:proton antiporter domain-containing protein n=1 Tax=Carboxylicivirga sp. M1479 TaxID=2594476 RepID=UPI001177D880|nr:cation:proton antiporter [Carboxylicivirga sp. M1479]TRX62985.1 sodium:proton antiporter [Carboxylicivirga sp. M1479]
MLLNIALIVTAALVLYYLFTLIKLPGILGLIVAGVVVGPSVLNVVDPEVGIMLKELKTAALIVILIRAGLGINRETLHKVGRPAINMSFIPGVIEGSIVMLAAHYLLDFTWIEGGIIGFIIAAVSPAVVVPTMLDLKEKGFGKKKEIPTLVLAGASVDDVFAITIFGVFTGLAAGSSINMPYLLWSVPAGILLGALIGVLLGFILVWFFKKFLIRDTKKVIIFMIVAVVYYELTELESLKEVIPLAGLLGIMAIGFIILEKYSQLAKRLSSKFNKVWVLSEILLFVYIGTEVRINELDASIVATGLLILLIGLTARSIGVWLALAGSSLNYKEKLFCVIAYWPKATVQAAIGAVPLTLIGAGKLGDVSLETGQMILAMAVLSIITTAPLGAIGIKVFGPKLLDKAQ